MHKTHNYIIADCETGGLSHLKNPITQIALQTVNGSDFSEISRFDTFVIPYGGLTLEDQAMKFTGITHVMLQRGMEAKDVVKSLTEEFQKANTGGYTKKPILVGHNIQFDIGFITSIFRHCKTDLSKLLAGTTDAHGNFYPAFIDTMWLSRMKYGYDESMTKFNLGACCEKRGVDLTDAHSAQNDVTATRELFIALTMDMRNGGNGSQGELLKESRTRDTFKFAF